MYAYMTHVCFYVFCSDCVGVCGNVCCVATVVNAFIICSGLCASTEML